MIFIDTGSNTAAKADIIFVRSSTSLIFDCNGDACGIEITPAGSKYGGYTIEELTTIKEQESLMLDQDFDFNQLSPEPRDVAHYLDQHLTCADFTLASSAGHPNRATLVYTRGDIDIVIIIMDDSPEEEGA